MKAKADGSSASGFSSFLHAPSVMIVPPAAAGGGAAAAGGGAAAGGAAASGFFRFCPAAAFGAAAGFGAGAAFGFGGGGAFFSAGGFLAGSGVMVAPSFHPSCFTFFAVCSRSCWACSEIHAPSPLYLMQFAHTRSTSASSSAVVAYGSAPSSFAPIVPRSIGRSTTCR